MITPVEIDNHTKREKPLKYSFCTLVSNHEEYRTLLRSCEVAGFTEDLCEFLYIDNSNGNKYDAYRGLNLFISHASGRYIVFIHQDTELRFDHEKILDGRIEEIEKKDPRWAVLSNAGARDIKRLYKRISHPDHELSEGPFPSKVRSVDENFIVLKKSTGVELSTGLKGFHFYGTDLCLQAERRGYSSYVIDFHILHKSTGNLSDSFYQARKAFMDHYSGKLSPGYIRTPCTIMFISGNALINRLMMKPGIISIFKFFKKTELLLEKYLK